MIKLKLRKKYLFVFVLVQSLFVSADAENVEVFEKNEVYLATIPKSGTHLVQKLMLMLDIELKYALEDKTNNPQPHLTHYLRINDIDKLEDVFSSKNKYIVSIRDPRDFMVSYINWVVREKDRKISSGWKSLSMEKKLSQLIKGNIPTKIDKFLWIDWHMENFFIASELMKKKLDNVLLLRFEDLIGSKGGGTDESQRESIKKICSFLDIEISGERLDGICSSLWGGTKTFGKSTKKVGQWVDEFQPKHVSLFKKNYNDLLVDLGYEDGPDWSSPRIEKKKKSIFKFF